MSASSSSASTAAAGHGTVQPSNPRKRKYEEPETEEEQKELLKVANRWVVQSQMQDSIQNVHRAIDEIARRKKDRETLDDAEDHYPFREHRWAYDRRRFLWDHIDSASVTLSSTSTNDDDRPEYGSCFFVNCREDVVFELSIGIGFQYISGGSSTDEIYNIMCWGVGTETTSINSCSSHNEAFKSCVLEWNKKHLPCGSLQLAERNINRIEVAKPYILFWITNHNKDLMNLIVSFGFD